MELIMPIFCLTLVVVAFFTCRAVDLNLVQTNAERGYAEAQHYMGVCYFEGNKVLQDFKEALSGGAASAAAVKILVVRRTASR